MFLTELQLIRFPGIIKVILRVLSSVEAKMIVVPIAVSLASTLFITFFLKEIHVTGSLCPLATGQGEFLPKADRQFFNIKNNSTLCFPGIRISLRRWQSRSLNIQDIQILVKKERQRYSNAKFGVKEALREGSLPRIGNVTGLQTHTG